MTTPRLAKSKITGNFTGSNGVDVLSPRYLSVSVSAAYDSDKGEYDGYRLRVWASPAEPIKVEWYKLQRDAKAVAVALLTASLDEDEYDLRWWVLSKFHDVHMRVMDAQFEIEMAKIDAKNAADRAAFDARMAETDALLARLRAS